MVVLAHPPRKEPVMTESHEGQVRELVDFDSAQWLPDFEPPNPSLIVHGKTRVPMNVTIEQPDVTSNDEYWPTEVVGYHPETTIGVETPYQVQYPMRNVKFGSKEIEVIGASHSENLDKLS
jgi:hypothetical protein